MSDRPELILPFLQAEPRDPAETLTDAQDEAAPIPQVEGDEENAPADVAPVGSRKI